MKKLLFTIVAFSVFCIAPYLGAAGFSGGNILSEYEYSQHQDEVQKNSVEDPIKEE